MSDAEKISLEISTLEGTPKPAIVCVLHQLATAVDTCAAVRRRAQSHGIPYHDIDDALDALAATARLWCRAWTVSSKLERAVRAWMEIEPHQRDDVHNHILAAAYPEWTTAQHHTWLRARGL